MRRARFAFLFAALALGHGSAGAQGKPATSEDLARLEAELREHRTLMMQMLKVQQQHFEMLLRMVQLREGGTEGRSAGKGPLPQPLEAVPETPGAREPAEPALPAAATATVTGRVSGKGDLTNVYVYLDGIKATRGRRRLEIKQKDRQFVPEFAVAPVGTRVSFPNLDAMYHNVFSSSPPKPFDLGTYRMGDPSPSVVVSDPGVIDVYCNIHSKMTAKVLVVPNAIYARVRSDGTFRLEKVPVGRRKIAAYAPDFKPARVDVEVGPGGAQVTISLDADPARPHLNKHGLPYGSYKE